MAKKKFYENIDLMGNELENAVLDNLSTPPENPKKGQVYFDTSENKEKYYDGTQWIGSLTPDEISEELEKKVDKVSGKELSENDFTDDYKSQVDLNTQNRHTHTNKTILDGTQESFTTDLKDNLDSNTSARHTHSNKAILDATSASYTTSEKTKLSGVASGAQVNVIESINVNGAAQTVISKAVNITVPTKTSQLQNDSEFVTLSDLDDSEAGIIEGLAGKVDKIEGKGLSTNDFTDAYKSQVDSNTSARHTHSNKAILDATNASFTTTINNTINSKANSSEVVKLTGDQTISGVKTFSSAVSFANKAMNILGDDASFGDGNVAGCMVVKGLNGASGIQFDPYSGTTSQKISINGSGVMTITGTVASNFSGNLNGTASRATADGNGNNIASTYATKAEIADLGVKKLSLVNPQLVPTNGVVSWTINYSSMGGLVANPPMISIKRNSDHKQIFAEVQFTLAGESCVITMNSTETIPAQTYTVTIIG